MKRGGPNHPKTYALAEALGIRRAHAVGILEMLFHFTAQYAPEGDIGKYSDKRIAAAVDWPGKPEKLMEALTTTGWVDTYTNTHSGVGRSVHGWSEHADRSVKQRLTRDGKMPIQLNHEVTVKLCTQSETDRNKKVHQPVPEPVPEPEPAYVRTFADTAERMYLRHPKQRDLPLLPQSLERACQVKPLGEIERVHALWCQTEDWIKKPQFVVSLPTWLTDRCFLREPPNAKLVDSRKLNIYAGPSAPVEGGL